ncbi:MAG TPA: hypothetical protein VFO35_09280, partial [Steroidobacteraceae bacterium]|nr:hypothetical protein [Steroidobacteraceae bacterium]
PGPVGLSIHLVGEERNLVVLHFDTRLVIDLRAIPSAQTHENAAVFPRAKLLKGKLGELPTRAFSL